MYLKTGELSGNLLKKCGEELQKKCHELAPLKPENVAVVEVKNVKAKFIYFIFLPNYKENHQIATKVCTSIVKTKEVSQLM